MRKISFLFICVMIALTLILPCAAEDATDVLTDVTTELVTEEMTEVVTTPIEDETAPTGDSVGSADGMNDEWETFKSKITDSATWTMIGAALMTVLTTVATVKSKFDKISTLVSGKADDETVKDEIKDMEKNLKAAYNENHKKLSATMQRYENALKNTEANEQRLYAILTLFMTNCKISESAKAEILSILADVKKYDGDIMEIVEQAQEAIDEAVKEAEGQVPPTPTLDKLLEEDYMELG